MARWILLALVTAGATYAVFFHELGNKSFSGHVTDVWRSPTMQEKVRMVERGVGSPWLSAPPPPPPAMPAPVPARGRPQAPPRNHRGAPTASNSRGSHDEADRKSLNALVNRLQRK